MFAAQPFRLGDRVAVRAAPGAPVSGSSPSASPSSPSPSSSSGAPPRSLLGGGRDGSSSYSNGGNFGSGGSSFGNGGGFSSAGAAAVAAAAEDLGGEREGEAPPSSWFDGRVEHVDLRYTVVRKGNARMFLPNSSFLTREFLVFDAPERQV